MVCKDMRAITKNVEHEDSKDKYVVAKAFALDNMLWYYGRYDTPERAKQVAEEITQGDVIGVILMDDIPQIREVKMAVDCAEEFIKHNELKEADAMKCKSIAYEQIKEHIK